jgi:hypothetical protein
VPAQIRWTLGNEAGGAFRAPVDHQVLGEPSGSTAMANDEPSDGTERRDGDDRRQAERRESGPRRKYRAGDRRGLDRRQEDRRK